jgi:pyrroline-5-carboxylate reductase
MSQFTHSIGILGVGHLVQHMIHGLALAVPASEILLSPRNADRVQALRDRYDVDVATDNVSLVAQSSTVFVAVRPFQIETAIADLPWQSEQTVVSLCAGVPISVFERYVSGARVVRALPVTAAEFGASPTCLFPNDPAVADLLKHCGPIIPHSTEESFDTASVMGCYYGWVQALVGELTDWLETNGVDPAAARSLAAEMTRAGATTIQQRNDTTLKHLVDELCIPGSYTGLGIDLMRAADAFTPWRQACQAVLDKSQDKG